MSKPETVFIESVHRHLPVGSPYRMKNHNEYVGGVFDCWYSGSKTDLWIEYKFIVLPKRDDTMIVPNLSALQLQWGNGRRDEGRNVAIVVGCKEGGVWLRHDQWAGCTTKEFRAMMVTRRNLADLINRSVNT